MHVKMFRPIFYICLKATLNRIEHRNAVQFCEIRMCCAKIAIDMHVERLKRRHNYFYELISWGICRCIGSRYILEQFFLCWARVSYVIYASRKTHFAFSFGYTTVNIDAQNILSPFVFCSILVCGEHICEVARTTLESFQFLFGQVRQFLLDKRSNVNQRPQKLIEFIRFASRLSGGLSIFDCGSFGYTKTIQARCR